MSIRIYAVRFEWHIQMLNDFEIPWHEFFRRYWWGGTAAGIYELRRLQIKRCGGSAKGPSSRLTVALRTVSATKKAVSVANWQKNIETGTTWAVSVANWQKIQSWVQNGGLS